MRFLWNAIRNMAYEKAVVLNSLVPRWCQNTMPQAKQDEKNSFLILHLHGKFVILDALR